MSETSIITLADLAHFARGFLASYDKGALVGLSGELGAGKTAFVRICIELLAARTGIEPPRVASPTFVFHQSYPALSPRVEHFDLYRLQNASVESLVEIGYFDAVDCVRRTGGFLFVEWPECVANRASLGLTVSLSISLEKTRRKLSVHCELNK